MCRRQDAAAKRRNLSMRRILFTILACTAMSAAVPAAALAHDGNDHHHKRHHHARVRHEHFVGHRHHNGDFGNQPTAGKVTSFANNVLTITLTNGNTVSGMVTDRTELKCENPEDVNNNGDNDNEHGDRGDDNGNDNMCTITPGEAVRNAELRIDGAGAVWDEVELIPSTSSST